MTDTAALDAILSAAIVVDDEAHCTACLMMLALALSLS